LGNGHSLASTKKGVLNLDFKPETSPKIYDWAFKENAVNSVMIEIMR
jgi:hypothetical protein